MKALVTGSAGFIGSNVVRALLRHGHDVRALHLPHEDTRNLRSLGLDIEPIAGDITCRSDLERGMKGCDVVFHLAAIYALWTPDNGARMRKVNVEGTKLVFDVAKTHVDRVVYTSSIARFGGQGLDRQATEQSAFMLGRTGDAYATSKAVAHEIAVHASRDQDIVIVAPCGPIGPGDVGPTPTGRLLLETLRMPFVLTTRTMTCFADVRDMAEAHVLAADPQKGKRGETYLLGSRDLWMDDIAEMAFTATGKRKPIINAPSSLASLAGHAAKLYADRISHRAPLFTSRAVKMAGLGLRANCTKAINDLGMPQSPIDRAVADAIAWFEQEGMVRKPN
jgi:dihydroflavonol-4-reductase